MNYTSTWYKEKTQKEKGSNKKCVSNCSLNGRFKVGSTVKEERKEESIFT